VSNSSAASGMSDPRLRTVGDGALTVDFGSVIDADLHARVMGLAGALEALSGREPALDGVEEVMASFSSLTVHFDPDVTDAAALETLLLALARRGERITLQGRHWLLPVCFAEEFAPDLAGLSALKGLSQEAIVALLTGATFRVYTIGFLPGFPYMGGLPEALHVPRLTTPRAEVPPRSIAIAGAMCAAYPWASPGGWHLVGRTPLRLFDGANAARPALLAAGDSVRWQAVSREAFAALEARDAAGALDPAEFLDRSIAA
jgi:inhibitor of KinA